MPAAQRPSALLLIAVGAVFLGGIGFGAVAALTQPRQPVVAKGASETSPDTEQAPDTKPKPAPTPTKKSETTKKAEPKPEPPKKGDPKPTAKTEPTKKAEPKSEPPKTVVLTYEKDILPLFRTKCLNCHGAASTKGGLDLRTLSAALVGGDTGEKGAVAGKPEESSIWKEIDNGTMPKDPKERLTAVEKKLVKDWILGGAK